MSDGQPHPRTLRQWFGIYLRGAMMGVAELVPGVSGGTIAFVTGIYDELVHTLAGLKPTLLAEFRHGPVDGCVRIWTGANLTFLLALGLGMVTAVVLLAHALSVALDGFRPVVWGFFLGIILLSIWLLGRGLPMPTLLKLGPVGALAGLGLIWMEPFGGSQSLLVFFLAAAIAVSAWLLPAVSGSFVLLTLGLYESVIEALATPYWDVLAVFLAGCAAGLLLFSRALSILLHRVRDQLLAVLTGFMAGASLQLWPWQVDGSLVSPGVYQAGGEPGYVAASIACSILGALVIWLLSRLDR
jgi:putative membrane protein